MCAKQLQSCPVLCNPMDCSLPGSSVHGILQQEYWSRLPCPPQGDLPDSGIKSESLKSPAMTGGFFTTNPIGKPNKGLIKSIKTLYVVFQTLSASVTLVSTYNSPTCFELIATLFKTSKY